MEGTQNLTVLLDTLNLEQAKKEEKVRELKETKAELESKLIEVQKRKACLNKDISQTMKESLLLEKDMSSLSSKIQSLTNDPDGMIRTKIKEVDHVETELESNNHLFNYFKQTNNICEMDTSSFLHSVYLAESFGAATSQLGSLTKAVQTIDQVSQLHLTDDKQSLSKLRRELEESKAELDKIIREKLKYEENCETYSKLIGERKAIVSKHQVTQRIKEKKLLAQKIRLERLLQQGKTKSEADSSFS